MKEHDMERISDYCHGPAESLKTAAEQNENAVADEDVVNVILEGDSNRFEILVNRYRSLLFSIISKHVPYDMVEEVAQDAFIRIYQSLNKFRGDGTFKSWITKITYRTCYDFWRVRYRNREVSLEPISEKQKLWFYHLEASRSRDEFEDVIARAEAKEVLDWALNRLTAEDRMVLTILHLEEHSVKETADILGWSQANVKIRAYRSRKKLLDIIKTMN